MRNTKLFFMIRQNINGGTVVLVVSTVLLLSLVMAATALVRSQAMSSAPSEIYGELADQIDTRLVSINRQSGVSLTPVDWDHLIAARAEPASAPTVEIAEEPLVIAPEVVGAEARLTLDGILWNSQLPMALVNNQLVGPGDRVSGCRVVSIVKEVVTFETDEGVIRTCALYEDLDVKDVGGAE